MAVDKQKLLPINGMNMDSDEQFVPETQATFIKNHINAVNNLEDGASGGQSTNALTPYPSISTNFDDAYLPHLRSYTIDLSAIVTAFGTGSVSFVSFVRDTTEIDVGSVMNNLGDLSAIMVGSGWTALGGGLYDIINTTYIWQKVIYRITGNDYYSSALAVKFDDGAVNGNNTCIGSYYDLKLNQMVWFNYNDANRHNIQLYNATADTYITVLETPLLNFDLGYRISSIDLVQAIVQTDEGANPLERLLYWTDKTNPPRKINIDRAILDEYWNSTNYLNYTVDDEFMCVAKAIPIQQINAVVNVDSNNNYIDGRSYNFAYNYVYDDGEKSKWYETPFLTIAMLDIPNPENQFIDLKNIGAGSAIVSKINLAYRIGNTGDWRQFTTIYRSDWLSNTNIATYIDSYSLLTFKTTFSDATSWSILDQDELGREYDKVPELAGSQEFLDNNILAYGDILSDKDNLTQTDIAKLSVSVAYGAAFNPASFTQGEKEALKGGGTYQCGLIMKDEFGRSSYVQTSDALSFYINTVMENGGLLFQNITFNFGGLVFPDWVKTVTLCRTKNLSLNRSLGAGFIQYPVKLVLWYDDAGNTYANAAAAGVTKVGITITGLDKFNTDNYNQTTTAYQFAAGDRITIMTCNTRASYVNAAIYGTITKQVRSTDGISLIFDFDDRFAALQTAGTAFKVGDVVEIWTPAETNTKLFYEISPPLVIDQATHTYTPNTYLFSNTTTVAYTTNGTETWDTYFIHRDTYPLDDTNPTANTFTFDFESPYFSDTILESQGEDIGRVNAVNENAGQLWYPSLVRYSMPYVQDTFINGLSTFDSGREKTFFRQYGNITRMYCEQFNLCLIQEEKAFRVMVNRNLLTTATGDNQVTLTNAILSDAIEIQGNFGCQNGETFIGRQGQLYWWDLKRGVFVGGSFERVEDISALYDKDGNAQGIQTYALKQSKEIFNNNSGDIPQSEHIYIHAGFDPKNNHVLFTNWLNDIRGASFVNNNDRWIPSTNDTVAFKTAGYWQSFLSFTPEMYSMVEGKRNGNCLVSFKNGVPYYHNQNDVTDYLNFYGTVCDKYVGVVFNKGSNVKNPMNIAIDSKNKSVTLLGTKYSATSVITSNNQASTIPITSFVQKEGCWYSPFYRNTNLGKTIITGDVLKATWVKILLKGDTDKNSEYSELRGVTVLFNESKYTV